MRAEAVGRLIDPLVDPSADDPLSAIVERIAAEAPGAGLIDDEIEAKLAAYNAGLQDRRFYVMGQAIQKRSKPADLPPG